MQLLPSSRFSTHTALGLYINVYVPDCIIPG